MKSAFIYENAGTGNVQIRAPRRSATNRVSASLILSSYHDYYLYIYIFSRYGRYTDN